MTHYKKKRFFLPLAAFSLSLPATYLAVSLILSQFSHSWIRLLLPALFLLTIGFIFGKIFRRRHASVTKMIVATFTTTLTAYILLAFLETKILPIFFRDLSYKSSFLSDLSLYLSYHSAPTICVSLIAIYLTRTISQKIENENLSKLFM